MYLHEWLFYSLHKNREGNIEGNIAGWDIYNPNNLQIVERFLGYSNNLCTELNTILLAIKAIQTPN